MSEKDLTGYPSIDKPWLKYYSEEAINAKLPECTIYEYLWENNKDHLNDIALIYFDRKITYKKLFEQINICAKSLTAYGVTKGDIITIQTLAIPQTVVLIYALSKIGAVANLIYVSDGEKEVNQSLIKTNSKLYFVLEGIYGRFKDVLDGSRVEKVVLLSIDSEMDTITKIAYRLSKKRNQIKKSALRWSEFMSSNSCENELNVSDFKTPVVMVYTGGTTGNSKGVVLSNKSINELVFQYKIADMGFVRQDVFMDSLPPFIAFGLTVALHLPLCMGVKTVLVPDPSPENTGKMFVKYKPNYYVASPPQIRAIMNNKKSERINLSFVKLLATGGDFLPPSHETEINNFLIRHNCSVSIVQGYGMSELSATVCTGSGKIARFGTVGIPLPNTNVKIHNTETNLEVGYNTQGEVCVCAPSIMMGYFNNEIETNELIKKHEDGKLWVHTGDIGVIDEDGFLTIVGRIKRMISVYDGELYHKVFPKLLEDKIEQLTEIQSAVVVGNGKKPEEQKLIAFIVVNSGMTIDENKLFAYAEECLQPFERPAIYKFINEIPKTKIGKVDYRALEKEALEL